MKKWLIKIIRAIEINRIADKMARLARKAYKKGYVL